jgi:hypothetical protein
MKFFIRKSLQSIGYDIVKYNKNKYPDIEPDFWQLYQQCKHATMTSVERMFALYKACEYVVQNQIEGDFVECGVWKGGSSMLAALTFNKFQNKTRNLYLYDTYEGMSEPTEKDISVTNIDVSKEWSMLKKSNSNILCISTLEEVEQNIFKTNYPKSQIKLIKGKVEDTIPGQVPSKISILRLDTDWYESTYHELKHLYPLLSENGVLIIDDYGHWKGAREAVDQFFNEINFHPLLTRIDYTGRIMIKNN